jgi:hypothetical protein
MLMLPPSRHPRNPRPKPATVASMRQECRPSLPIVHFTAITGRRSHSVLEKIAAEGIMAKLFLIIACMAANTLISIHTITYNIRTDNRNQHTNI